MVPLEGIARDRRHAGILLADQSFYEAFEIISCGRSFVEDVNFLRIQNKIRQKERESESILYVGFGFQWRNTWPALAETQMLTIPNQLVGM